jgi:hypothetical protein
MNARVGGSAGDRHFPALGADCADFMYTQAWVDGNSVYRITGNRGTYTETYPSVTRDEAGLDIAPHGEPWKKIRILKDEAPLCAWRCDWLVAYQDLAFGWKNKAGDETQQSGLPAAARTHD